MCRGVTSNRQQLNKAIKLNTAAANVERRVDSAIEPAFNKLDGIFSLNEDQTTALKAYVEKKDVSFSSLWAASTVLLLSKPML